MCGIAGQLAGGSGEADPVLLRAMADRIRHRGPDGEGYYVKGPLGLAHRRLAIIDLSEAAAQPMATGDGTLRIVYNGEIYNYVELREDLTRLGHRFRTVSDTEVILHAYREWGTGCLARLRGMWAFALWDTEREQLFCARDRFGIKPFYYTLQGGSFLFASEIKALRVHPDVGRRPDDRTLLTFLAWGVSDHSERTMVDGILQIPPAHFLVVKTGGVEGPVRYWDLAIREDGGRGTRDDDRAAAREFLEVLRDAVRIHLRSDVPVGTCLSGGIDSSTLTVLINELIREEHPASVGERQKTFSVGFADSRFDESGYADLVVARTGVDAHRVVPDAEGFWQDLPRLLEMQDEPFASLSIHAQYSVMRLAARQVKVVLDGQGADEQLAGYLGYQWSHVRGLLASGHLLTALREAAGILKYHRGFARDGITQLRVRRRRRGLIRGTPGEILRYRGSLPRILYREIFSTNLPALLHWEDRNAMAFSIESRVPFLDHRVAENLAAQPENRRIRGGVTKWILREAIRGIVPDEIRCRIDKMGFVTPEEVWMGDALAPQIREIFSSPSFASRPYWDPEAVSAEYQRYLEGKSPYSPEFWRIACTELWLRAVFDGQSAGTGR
ncbi:MAG: asparagine synthase (glutamine-hydrolyzing) [Methanomicrobiales archaeon]|nr:asparagine synthase (glutamine-hydrolyzing) [Methanomicrobiales archaeon]